MSAFTTRSAFSLVPIAKAAHHIGLRDLRSTQLGAAYPGRVGKCAINGVAHYSLFATGFAYIYRPQRRRADQKPGDPTGRHRGGERRHDLQQPGRAADVAARRL